MNILESEVIGKTALALTSYGTDTVTNYMLTMSIPKTGLSKSFYFKNQFEAENKFRILSQSLSKSVKLN